LAHRVTTQELHDTIHEKLDSLIHRVSKLEERTSLIERDVQGNNGEGLWDVMKSLRSEYRKDIQGHREEHRRLWERLTHVEESAEKHFSSEEGARQESHGRQQKAWKDRSERRRRFEVWALGGVAIVVAVLQFIDFLASYNVL